MKDCNKDVCMHKVSLQLAAKTIHKLFNDLHDIEQLTLSLTREDKLYENEVFLKIANIAALALGHELHDID